MNSPNRPSPALLDQAEISTRTALIYGSLLAGRFALARTAGKGLVTIEAEELARVAAAARELVASVDAILHTLAPQLAVDVKVIASEACRREMAVPRRPRPPLVLVGSSATRPVGRRRSVAAEADRRRHTRGEPAGDRDDDRRDECDTGERDHSERDSR